MDIFVQAMKGFTPFTRTKINYKTCNKRLNILIHKTVLLNSNDSISSFMLINEFINIIPFSNSLTNYQFLCQK